MTCSGEDVQLEKHSSIAAGSEILFIHYGNKNCSSSENCESIYLKIQYTTIGNVSKDAPSYHKDPCSTIFIAVLFIIARSWQQPKCPSIGEWIKKFWYT